MNTTEPGAPPEHDAALDGEILPNDAVAHSGEGGVLQVAGAIAIGALMLAGSAPREEPAKLRRPKRRRRRRGGRGRSEWLPEWLEDMDRVGENTEIRERKLPNKNWGDCATEDDAIVFMGCLVRRKVATEAAILLRSKALVGLALRKMGYQEIVSKFFSEGIRNISKFDVDEPIRLAAIISDKVDGTCAWSREFHARQALSLREKINQIIDECKQSISKAESEISTAWDRVQQNSRKKPKPGMEDYETTRRLRGSEIARHQRELKDAAKALQELDLSKLTPAVEFVRQHEKRSI